MAKGKTLWEMLVEKLSGPVEQTVHNPLKAKIGSAVTVNELDWRDFNFFVREIREYRRTIGGKPFVFVDYVLLARPLGGDDVLARLRLNPVDDPDRHGGLTHHALLLRLCDELAYSEELHRVVTDSTKKFQVLQDGQLQEEYYRINDVADSYKAQVSVVKDANRDKKVERDEVEKLRLEYWDYWRETKDPAGLAVRQYLFVEMDADNGWFEIWRGHEIAPEQVLVF